MVRGSLLFAVILVFSLVLPVLASADINQTVDLGLGAQSVFHVPNGGGIVGQSFVINRAQNIIVTGVDLDPVAGSNFPDTCYLFDGNAQSIEQESVNATTHAATFTGGHVFPAGSGFQVGCGNFGGTGYNASLYNGSTYPVQSQYFAWMLNSSINAFNGRPFAFRTIHVTVVGVSAAQHFSVSQVSTGGGAAVTQVTVSPPSNNAQYRYTVACDTHTTPFISATFNTNFNFTGNTPFFSRVLASPTPSGNYLTFNSWTVSYNLTDTAPFLQLYAPQSFGTIKATTQFSMSFSLNDSAQSSFALIFGTADDRITDYLELTKNGPVMTFEDVVPGGGRIFLGNATINPGRMNLSISYIPRRVVGTGQEYFDRVLSYDGTNLPLSSTIQHPGPGFNNVEFASDINSFDANERKTLSIYSISLSYGSFLFPPFIEFQNGMTVGNTTTPPPVTELSGSGFSLIPVKDGVFNSDCGYPQPGMYTQRHYLAPLGVDDYTNFEDLIVTVSNASQGAPSCISGNDCTNGICTGSNCTFSAFTTNTNIQPPSQTGDLLQDGLNNLLFTAGITGTGSKLMIWLLISAAIAAVVFVLFAKNVVMGLLAFIIMFIAGVFFGFVPFWILIILVLLAAAVAAIGYRRAAAA